MAHALWVDQNSGISPLEVERSIDDGGMFVTSPDIGRLFDARRWCEHSLRSRFVPRPGLVSCFSRTPSSPLRVAS